jgi:hypothetical protein
LTQIGSLFGTAAIPIEAETGEVVGHSVATKFTEFVLGVLTSFEEFGPPDRVQE